MRLWLFLILIACLSPLSGASTSPDKRVEMFYGVAQGNYLIGDYAGATRGCDEVLRIQPDYLPALKLKTRVLLDEGESAAAMEAVARALEVAPTDLENQLLKALILGNQNQRAEAIALTESVLAKAAPASGDYRAANQLLGLLRMAEGNWDDAAAAFNRNYLAAPEDSPESLQLASEAYLEKARRAVSAANSDEAIAAIEQAIELHANATGMESLQQRSSLRLLRARMLAQNGRIEKAISALQALTGQESGNLEALVTLASLYAASGRWQSVDQLITPIAQQAELKDIALYLEGRAALAQGRIGKARALFEEALALQPDAQNRLAPSLHFYRGVCLSRLDRVAEAEPEVLQALDAGFKPETADEAALAGETLLRLKQAERAIPILEAITLNRIQPSPAVWALLGRAQEAAGNTERAISAFNESLKMAPEQADVLALRASLFRRRGNLIAAAADYERALALTPDNPALPYALALVYFQNGVIAEASQLMAYAAGQHPDRADIALFQSLFSYVLGDFEESRAALAHYSELQQLQSESPNETALYLRYALTAPGDYVKAVQELEAVALQSVPLGYFYSYSIGKVTRKEVLDHAAKASSPKAARAQLCEALFWMAQHEFATDSVTRAKELLQLAVDLQAPDLAEYQLAKWQLANWH